jgi:hypothetical protein
MMMPVAGSTAPRNEIFCFEINAFPVATPFEILLPFIFIIYFIR